MNYSTAHQTVLLIGASRGLGLAIAEQYLKNGASVVATVRGSARTALHDLQDNFDQLEIESVDITDARSVAELHARLAGRMFELLFVNAGVTNREEETVVTTSAEEFSRLMLTNALSPMRLIETFGELVSAPGTIAIMSSGQGSISNNNRGGFEIYRASKSALNQLMRSYAARQTRPHALLLIAPGWIKNTGVGGPNATLTIEESIPRLVQTVDAQFGRNDLQFLDYRGETVPW